MRLEPVVVAFSLASSGCIPTQGDGAADARRRAVDPDVTVELRAPADHAPSLVGAARSPVGIVVTNRAKTPLVVAPLHTQIDVTREGVSFRCSGAAQPLPGSREPAVLGPGASFRFERTIDCVLPLAGSYAVSLALSFGDPPTAPITRAFVLSVTASPKSEPRQVDDSALWAALDGTPSVGKSGGPEHPRFVLGLVNAGAVPLELPRMRVATKATRAGSRWSCASEPAPLALPSALGGGAIHREPVAVSCLGFDVPGAYDVDVELVTVDRRIDLGRLRIDVANHPSLTAPPPW